MPTPNDIADWLLCRVDRESGDSITHLKLQKLLYYAQAWSLVLLEQELFEENFQAWTHGPVLRSIFDRFNGRGWEALEAPEQCPQLKNEQEELLTEVLRVYGEHTGKTLEYLTHSESPWIEARGNLSPEERCTTVISKESMKKFYSEKYQKAQQNGQA